MTCARAAADGPRPARPSLPRRRTGRRNGPRAPSPPSEDTPSNPTRLMGGSLPMAHASHDNAGGTSSKGGIARPSHVRGTGPQTRRKQRPHRVCRVGSLFHVDVDTAI